MANSITTFLMFDGDAQEAITLYTSLFDGSKVTSMERYGEGEEGTEGSVKRANFTLNDQNYICIDSPVSHEFHFTPSTSLFVECENDEEITMLFDALSSGGTVLMPIGDYGFSKKFAWINDKFGVSWQLNLV